MSQQSTKYTVRTHSAKREMIREYKERIGCACGERRSVCLDLHHRDPETKHPKMAAGPYRARKGRALFQLSWAAIVEEIAKCDVLCANCHRAEHLTPKEPIVRTRHPQPQELEARRALNLEEG